MSDIVIVGAGGFGREVLDVIRAMREAGSPVEPAGFLDDRTDDAEKLVNGVPVLGGLEWAGSADGRGCEFVVGVGTPQVRRRIVRRLEQLGARFATLVHPRTVASEFVQIGEGSVLTAGCILTNRITIGRHVIVNLACTVGHDAVIGDYCTLAPGVHVSGFVRLGEGVDVGTGTVINQQVEIGGWTVVGSGAAVVADLPGDVTAVGVPARPIKHREAGWHLR